MAVTPIFEVYSAPCLVEVELLFLMHLVKQSFKMFIFVFKLNKGLFNFSRNFSEQAKRCLKAEG